MYIPFSCLKKKMINLPIILFITFPIIEKYFDNKINMYRKSYLESPLELKFASIYSLSDDLNFKFLIMNDKKFKKTV